jgi:hypothetical protein
MDLTDQRITKKTIASSTEEETVCCNRSELWGVTLSTYSLGSVVTVDHHSLLLANCYATHVFKTRRNPTPDVKSPRSRNSSVSNSDSESTLVGDISRDSPHDVSWCGIDENRDNNLGESPDVVLHHNSHSTADVLNSGNQCCYGNKAAEPTFSNPLSIPLLSADTSIGVLCSTRSEYDMNSSVLGGGGDIKTSGTLPVKCSDYSSESLTTLHVEQLEGVLLSMRRQLSEISDILMIELKLREELRIERENRDRTILNITRKIARECVKTTEPFQPFK